MTPKDWNEIKKLLEPVADQETVQKVKELIEEGVTVGFRSPIKITHSENSLTGTGQGVLFFRVHDTSNDPPVTMTVDGTELGFTAYDDAVLHVEFRESFSVNIGSYTHVTAIFY